MDVSGSKGVQIVSGFLYIRANSLLTGVNDQVGTIKGDFVFAGGSIGFPDNRPTVMQGNEAVTAWFTLKVDGAVTWSGGTFAPGVDGSVGAGGNMGNEQKTDLWQVTGKITVDRSKQVKPKIEPTALDVPQGQQVAGNWYVIKWDSTEDENKPDGANGFTVDKDNDGKRFKVSK